MFKILFSLLLVAISIPALAQQSVETVETLKAANISVISKSLGRSISALSNALQVVSVDSASDRAKLSDVKLLKSVVLVDPFLDLLEDTLSDLSKDDFDASVIEGFKHALQNSNTKIQDACEIKGSDDSVVNCNRVVLTKNAKIMKATLQGLKEALNGAGLEI